MNMHLKHRRTVCPPELAKTIREKMSRFTRLLPRNSYVEVEISELAHDHTHGTKRAEVIVDLPGKTPVLRFSERGTTFLEALDRIFDRMDARLSARKQRLAEHKVRGLRLKERVIEDASPL